MKLNEINNTTSNIVFHGDNYGTRKLEPKFMMHDKSNNEVGVGIYFSPDKELASGYGDKISQITITNDLYIVDGNKAVGDIINHQSALNLLKYINLNDDEFWYMVSDYVYATEREDVTDDSLEELYDMVSRQEIRNFQIEVAQATNIDLFVSAWNKFIKIDGLYEADRKFYAIINPSIPVTPVNF